MKISTTQYAKTLYDLTKDKSQRETGDTIANFVKLLARSNRLKLAPQIIAKFSEIYNKKNNIIEAEVTSANKLESSQIRSIESYLKEKYKVKEVIIENKVVKNIKGGIVIKVGDEILDASLAKNLQELKNKLIL